MNFKNCSFFCIKIAPAVVECVLGVVLKSSLVGEVTPPGLRGEGDDRVRANNLKKKDVCDHDYFVTCDILLLLID